MSILSSLGKSHSLGDDYDLLSSLPFGSPSWLSVAGILPSSVRELFQLIDEDKHRNEYAVQLVYVEIYNEVIYDLLSSDRVVGIAEHRADPATGTSGGFVLKGATEALVQSYEDCIELVKKGAKKRSSSGTSLNARSSRSHALFMLYVSCCSPAGVNGEQTIKRGRLNLVDLAGSERLSQSKVEGVHKREASNINQSLFSLGRCISAIVKQQSLTDSAAAAEIFLPFRSSKLTMILKDSLAGSARTLVLACIRGEMSYYESTLSTLRFASLLKSIKNKPIVNEDNKDKLLRQLQEQIQQMKAQLEKQGGGVGVGDAVSSVFSPSLSPLSSTTQLGNEISSFIHSAAAQQSRGFLTKFISLARAAGAMNYSPYNNTIQLNEEELEQKRTQEGDSSATVSIISPQSRGHFHRRALSASAIDLSALTLQASEAAAELHNRANTAQGSTAEKEEKQRKKKGKKKKSNQFNRKSNDNEESEYDDEDDETILSLPNKEEKERFQSFQKDLNGEKTMNERKEEIHWEKQNADKAIKEAENLIRRKKHKEEEKEKEINDSLTEQNVNPFPTSVPPVSIISSPPAPPPPPVPFVSVSPSPPVSVVDVSSSLSPSHLLILRINGLLVELKDLRLLSLSPSSLSDLQQLTERLKSLRKEILSMEQKRIDQQKKFKEEHDTASILASSSSPSPSPPVFLPSSFPSSSLSDYLFLSEKVNQIAINKEKIQKRMKLEKIKY